MKGICKNQFARKGLSIFLAIIMLLGVVLMPQMAHAQSTEDLVMPMEATPPPNWEAPEPGNPNYWPIPQGSTVANTNLAFIGLRYNGVTNNTIQLTMPTTLSATSITLKNVQLNIDSDLLPYVKEVRARSFVWLVEGVPSYWRTMTPVAGQEGVFEVPFFWVNQGLFPVINAGALNQFHVPIEIVLKDGYTTANIPQEPYVVQLRVNAERRGRNIVAWESMGKATVVFPTPTTGREVSNWLSKPAIMGAEYNEETNVLRYFWRGNPIVTYRFASVNGMVWRNKPYMLNVIADPAIIEASEQLEIYAHNLVGREGPHYVMNKAKLEEVFSDTSNPGYRSAKITPDNGSVNTVDNYIYQDAGGPDVPVYTILEFKINPEKLFVQGQENYHINAPIKVFFTEKLNSTQRLIKYSAAENFFMISKSFYLPEVNDIFTEDTVVTGYTYYGDMMVKVTLPNGREVIGRSAEDPDDTGKYPFSIDIPAGVNLEKGQEVKVQNAERGKAFGDPVYETVNAKITFNYNYEGAPEALVVEANDDKNINNLGDLMPEDPEREGFVFTGWYDNPEGTGEEFTAESTIINSKQVYAKWDTAVAYTVKYIVDKVEDKTLEETGFVPQSKPVLELEKIKKDIEGKNFLYVEPKEDSLGLVTVPADGIIKMHYAGDIIDVTDPNEPTPDGYSRIVFDAGENGKFEDGVVYMFDVKNGTEFPAEKAPVVTANDGYEFLQWNPNPPFVVNEAMTIVAEYKETIFNPDKVVGMKITTPPNKVEYFDGETFDPAGMVVTLTDANGLTKEVPYEEFENNYLSVPTDVLTLDDTKVIVTYEKDTKILRDEQPITVNEKLPSAKPIDLKQVYEDDEQKIVGKFENNYKPDPNTSEVILVDKDGKPYVDSEGNPIKGTINEDGTFEFPIVDLKDKDEVFVQLLEEGKKPTVSDESIIVDKLGPEVDVIETGVNENFNNIKAKVDEPDAEVIIKIGDKEVPVTPDSEGNFEYTFPSEWEGDIVIVAKDELGNITEKEIERDEFLQVDVKVRGKKPFAGNFTFTAYGADGITAKIVLYRDDKVLETQEKVIVNGRANFVLSHILEINDLLTLQGISGSHSSEPISYFIDR